MNRRALWALVALAAFAPALQASDTAGDVRFRADDGNLWHLGDNPALWGALGGMAVGVSWSPEALDPQGNTDIVLFSPLASFRLAKHLDQTRVEVGTSLNVGSAFSLGYLSRQLSTATEATSQTDFGALWRPWDVLSLGATAENALGVTPVLGLGVALRPLALWPVKAPFDGFGSLVTLTADAHLDLAGNLTWESSGLRAELPGGVGLRGWYEAPTQRFGAELSLDLGPTQTRLASPNVLQPLDFRAGTALTTWGNSAATVQSPWTPKILRLRDVPALAGAAVQPGLWASLLGVGGSPTVGDLLEVLDRVVKDPGYVAVAFENPPTLGGLADYQEVTKALDALHRAGKKLYVYADALTANGAYQALWSQADKLVLNPNGGVAIRPLETERLYYKDLFDKLGIRFYNLAPWDTKSYSNDLSFASMPPGERAMNLRMLGELQDQFSLALTAARGAKLQGSAVELVNAGPYLIPAQALAAGLVDALDYRASFEVAVKKDHPGSVLVDDLPWGAELPWGPSPLEKTVAVVTLQGDIVLGAGVSGSSIGTDTAEVLARLRDDSRVAAVLLKVDSPGGVVITSDVIAEEVRLTVAAGKPVVAVMGNYGASGGYYVSAFASRIVARPGTLTGSIGVTAVIPSVAGALDKLGVHPDSAALSPSAGFADPYRELRAADLKALNDEIASIYDRFVNVVAKGRKLTPEQVKLVGEGQVWTGREALGKGLVDELGGLEEAKAWLEAQLGGRVNYETLLPGQTDSTSGLDQILPTFGAAKQLKAVAGPVLDRLARWTALGLTSGVPAPLVWAGELGVP
ncbi:MAG: signal peptide peptidase SppA [Spirochaetales bacterium]